MYCLSIKDKDGFGSILADQTGRIFAYDTLSNARVSVEAIRQELIAELRTVSYETIPIAFGLLTKRVAIAKPADYTLRIRRIIDTIMPIHCAHFPLPVERVNFGNGLQMDT